MSNRKGGTPTKVEKDSTNSAEFLLQEYEQLESERVRLRSEAVNRLNVFLTLTSALLGGIVLFGQSPNTIKIEYIILVAVAFLLMVGWEFHRFMISRDINTDKVVRAQARVRRYFVNADPSIEHHLSWRLHDEPFSSITKNNSGIRRTLQSILSFLVAIFAGITASILI